MMAPETMPFPFRADLAPLRESSKETSFTDAPNVASIMGPGLQKLFGNCLRACETTSIIRLEQKGEAIFFPALRSRALWGFRASTSKKCLTRFAFTACKDHDRDCARRDYT